MNKNIIRFSICACAFVGIIIFSVSDSIKKTKLGDFIKEQKSRLTDYNAQLVDFDSQLRSVDNLLRYELIGRINTIVRTQVDEYRKILDQVVPIVNRIPDAAIRLAQQGDVKDMLIAMDNLLTITRSNIIKIRDRFEAIERMVNPATDTEKIYEDAADINKNMKIAIVELGKLEDFVNLLGLKEMII